jgi:hypothetical protein
MLLSQGEVARARACAHESLQLAQSLNLPLNIGYALRACAALGSREGRWTAAARLLAVASQWPTDAFATYRLEEIETQRTLAAVRAQLDEATFNAAWAEGRVLTAEQALALALELSSAAASRS